MGPNETQMLLIRSLEVSYGPVKAIRGIDIDVFSGEIVALLGGNGAGKTTTLKAISGMINSDRKSSIKFLNQDITRLNSYQLVARGMAHSPEGRMIFANLSVKENLEMGAYLRRDHSQIKKDLAYVFYLFPRLKERYYQEAGTLSGGEQQMLAISRAYMAAPKLLLLDEPSLGIAPILVKTIFSAIEEINKKGVTVLLVEQNTAAALRVASRAYVLAQGKISVTGRAEDLKDNPEVKKAYLGGD